MSQPPAETAVVVAGSRTNVNYRIRFSRVHWEVARLQDTGRWSRVGYVDTLEEGRTLVDMLDLHAVEVKLLGRREIQLDQANPVRTPWGAADDAIRYGDGIVLYGTPSHGGFRLDEAAQDRVHPALRSRGGWYEEDCEAAVVAHTFPHLFTTYERQKARRTLIDWTPYAFMKATGETIATQDSRGLRQEAFADTNRERWVVTSALTCEGDPDTVRCHAKLGGDRGNAETRIFLVPADEYAARGPFGFVVDVDRHQEEIAPAPGR